MDINDLNKKTLLPGTEKCTCLALKVDCSHLCVGVRKKTLVFAINANGNEFRYVNYIPSKGASFPPTSSLETPRCMEWLDSTLFVGCKIAYYLQDTESFSITKTALTKCTKSNQYLLSVALSTHSEVLLVDSDNSIHIVDKQGIPTRQVLLPSFPSFLGTPSSPLSPLGTPHTLPSLPERRHHQPHHAAHPTHHPLPVPLRRRQDLPLRLQPRVAPAHPGRSPRSPSPLAHSPRGRVPPRTQRQHLWLLSVAVLTPHHLQSRTPLA